MPSDATPPTRPLFIGTNTKLHQTPAETAEFVAQLAAEAADLAGSDAVRLYLCPPYTSVPGAAAARDRATFPLWVGGQDCAAHHEGAYTGEVSAAMLAASGADVVLLGHAERRAHFGETDETLRDKVPHALAAGLRVILCVGESAAQRDAGEGLATVRRQVEVALADVEASDLDRVLVAYEPVWAIGADEPAGPADIRPVLGALDEALGQLRDGRHAATPLLYGGSVSVESAGPLLSDVPRLDGFLLGRVGLSVEGLTGVAREALAARGHAAGAARS